VAFEDLRELLDEQVLRLPIAGTVYTVQACSAEDWLWLNTQSAALDQAMRTGDVDASVEGSDPEVFYRRCLGDDVFEEMIAGDVTSKELQVASLTGFLWQLGNIDAAERVWANAGKALLEGQTTMPNRATRRTTSRTSAKRATSATSRGTSASSKAKTTRASSRRTA
jgi:hypothetical protein